jgi:hypothetical protein
MKTMNCKKIIAGGRFAACVDGARLLSICVRAAGRAPAGKTVSPFHLSAGGISRDQFTSGSKNKANLTRCGIFRGKISRRKNQNQNTPRTKDALAPIL